MASHRCLKHPAQQFSSDCTPKKHLSGPPRAHLEQQTPPTSHQHTHTHTHTQTDTHTHTHTHTPHNTHTHTPPPTHTHPHTPKQTHSLTRTLIHTHKHSLNYTHSYTHTHTQAQTGAGNPVSQGLTTALPDVSIMLHGNQMQPCAATSSLALHR